jgi:diguanylate cyclase (GGDEF)-like protein
LLKLAEFCMQGQHAFYQRNQTGEFPEKIRLSFFVMRYPKVIAIQKRAIALLASVPSRQPFIYSSSADSQRCAIVSCTKQATYAYAAGIELRGEHVMKVNQKLLKVLYRLTLPGSLLLIISALLIRVGVLANSKAPAVEYFPAIVFGFGLALSAFFRRSRLFFALLVLGLAQTAFAWIFPRLSPASAAIATNAIGLLLPLDLLALAFLKERGIISPVGRRRLTMVALQIIVVTLLCIPVSAKAAVQIGRAFAPLAFSKWSGLSQPALAAFVLAAIVMMIPLVRRYKAVESSLFWSLIAAFIALRSAHTTHHDGVYFAAGGLALIVALIETSYAMAYLDELTQLPSRRALNEALLKLGSSYTIAMMDVDHFKKFNDSYGHEAGDQALRMVASRLAHITGGGRAYRYGGEEFAVVFPGKPSEEVFVYLDRMRRVIEQSVFTVRGKDRRKSGSRGVGRGAKKETSVTVSVGLASCTGENLTPAEVMRMADQALYKAKARGRNCTITAKLSKPAASARSLNAAMSV